MKIIIQIYTLLIFLNLIYYFALIGVINFPSYMIHVFLMVLVVLYYLLSRKKMIFNQWLLLWVSLYFILNTFYYLVAGANKIELAYYTYVLVNVFTFTAMSLLYSLDDDDLTMTRRSIVLAMLIGSIMLLYDFVSPGMFVVQKDYVSGRALATFGNQNLAGAILIVGLILTIDLIPHKMRLVYISALFIGVLVTISRSNIIIYIVVLFIMMLQKKISKLAFITLIGVIISLIIWLYTFGIAFLANEFDIVLGSDVTDRLAFFVDSNNVESHNDERKHVLMAALDMFMESPIYGNGIGSTRIWEFRVGPHNTFAANWAEFGLFGLLIIPSFLLASTFSVIFKGNKKYRDMGILFIVYFIFSSFFSHNMFEVTFNMCAAVIIATLGLKNSNKRILNV